MNTPDISVIVPVYNVEEYLRPCLDSLLRQEDIALEVIMIDDGSTDESGLIADQYASEYPFFKCVHNENGGLGHARNVGVKYATGKYIIFLDSDDIISDNAYTRMFRLAEKHDAELTICNVERFNSTKRMASPLHKKAFAGYEEVTHVSKNRYLLYDTTSWNKLIRRDFYEKNGFAFPERILYEDIPVTVPMHFLCNKAVMMAEMGYLWRVRDGGSKSITQMTSSMNNLIDRIKIIEMLDEFFEKNVTDEELILEKQVKHLETDLNIFVSKCASIPEEEAYEMLDRVNAYIDKAVGDEAFERLSVYNKQKYKHVRERDLPGLIRLLDYRDYNLAPVYEKDGRLYTDISDELFTVKERDVTNDFESVFPKVYIEDIETSEGELRIKAHLYRRRHSVAFGEQTVKAFLVNSAGRMELKTEAFADEGLTQDRGAVVDPVTGLAHQYNYDGTGFIISVNAEDIRQSSLGDGYYHIELEYENPLFSGREILKGINEINRAKYNKTFVTSGKTMAKLVFNETDEAGFILDHDCAFVDSVKFDGSKLVIGLSADTDSIAAQAVGRGDAAKAVAEKTGDKTFCIDCSELETGVTYRLTDESGEEGKALVGRRQGRGVLHGDCHAAVGEDHDNAVTVMLLKDLTYVRSWASDKAKLSLKTKRVNSGSKPVSARIVTEDKYSETWVCISDEAKVNGPGKCSLTVNLNKREVVKDFYAGDRDVFIEYSFADGTSVREPVYCDGGIDYKASGKCLKTGLFADEHARLALHIVQVWPKNQSTINKRREVINAEYPKYRKRPLKKNRIIFESMWGRNYSCNPQALYEYIDENYPGFECIWALNDARIPIKGKGKRVIRGSLEYYYYLATSKYLVNNVNFPNDYVKRKGQVEIQTMHGTPLKTLGLDVVSDFPTQALREQYIEKNQRWDYLIVQGKFMEEKAYPMFRFSKKLLKTGYPRTDRLFGVGKERVEELRKELGLPQGKKVILYTPTWRVKSRFDMKLEIEEMREALSDDYVLLIRLHHFCADGYTVPADNEFVFDFTKYNYIEDLYLVSDILITDYSSVMFDYALLGKPMVFFVYDIDEYCNKLRGLYVDFEEEAPGPICMTTAEVSEAIRTIDKPDDEVRARIDAFMDKYLSFERADSSELVVKEVMAPQLSSMNRYKFQRFVREGIYAKARDKAKDILRPYIKRK